MTIIIPMAGLSSRFTKAGYVLPKCEDLTAADRYPELFEGKKIAALVHTDFYRERVRIDGHQGFQCRHPSGPD